MAGDLSSGRVEDRFRVDEIAQGGKISRTEEKINRRLLLALGGFVQEWKVANLPAFNAQLLDLGDIMISAVRDLSK